MTHEIRCHGRVAAVSGHIARVETGAVADGDCGGCSLGAFCGRQESGAIAACIGKDLPALHVGDEVTLTSDDRWRWLAIWWLLVVPCLLMGASAATVALLGGSEPVMALAALAAPAVYAMVVAVLRRCGHLTTEDKVWRVSAVNRFETD